MHIPQGERSVLKKCFWKGRIIDCSAIFEVFPTDRGMCCSFNMHKVTEAHANNVVRKENLLLHFQPYYIILTRPIRSSRRVSTRSW